MRKLYKKILAASAIIALIIIFLVLGFIGFNFIELLIRTNQWFYSKLGALGIYIAIFLISILGTFSIMIPVPYQLGVITALLVLPVNPLMLAIVSAAGSVIGELSSWLLGRSASAITKKRSIHE